MPYESKFEFVDALPADAEKVSQIRKHIPINLFWSKSNQEFYTTYEREKNKVRKLVPMKNNYVYCRSSTGKSICIVLNKWKKINNKDDENTTAISEEAI